MITPRGLFRFDSETKEMYLAARHHGSTLDEIKAEVPWDLKVAEELGITPVPTDEEIGIMREIGPLIALGVGFTIQTTVESLMKFSRT